MARRKTHLEESVQPVVITLAHLQAAARDASLLTQRAAMGAAASATQQVHDADGLDPVKCAEQGQPARFQVTPLSPALKAVRSQQL